MKKAITSLKETICKLWNNVQNNVPFISLELAVVVIGVFLIFYSIFYSPTFKNPVNIPNAVTGFATMTGILSAFTGFWINHLYANSDDKIKEWLNPRIGVIVFVVGLSLLCILGSLTSLVYRDAETAMKTAVFGTYLIFLVELEVVFLTVYKAFWKKNWKE
jgi:uncharacterized membrane protein